MHISLTQNLETIVRDKVASGLYNNASEVVREALRIMLRQEEAEKAAYAEFRRQALLGHEQALNGEFSTKGLDELDRELEDEDGL